MFGVSPNPEKTFNIYHDESGTYCPPNGDRWLVHGVLFIPETKQSDLVSALSDIRTNTGYFEEVHYVKLRKSTKGAKPQCAKDWLNTYVSQFSDSCFYHCLAIDTHSPGFKHEQFSEPYHAYNYFAHVAVVGGIAWFLKRYKRVAIKIHSDKKYREISDNFSTYLPKAVLQNIEGKRKKKPSAYPEIRLLNPEVIAVESNPAKLTDESMKNECELTQLVDLITSNIPQAVSLRSSQKAKIALSEIVANWIEDIRLPPWLQTKELHRRFSVSFFPDENGNFFSPSLAVKERNQPSLL